MKTIKELRARVAALEKQIAAMRHIGGMMSNLCANWCQEAWGAVSDPRERETLRQLYTEWDEATKGA